MKQNEEAMKKIILFIIPVFMAACGSKSSPGNDHKGVTAAKENGGDTLSDNLQCHLGIGDEEIDVPADSVEVTLNRVDSSATMTIKGIKGGYMIINIPNLFAGPRSIPTGFTNPRNKIAGTDELAVTPAIDLYNYPVYGLNCQSYNDGYHPGSIKEDAVKLLMVRDISGDSGSAAKTFLIKLSLHATLLKNVYSNSAAVKAYNQDYPVKGGIVISQKLYL